MIHPLPGGLNGFPPQKLAFQHGIFYLDRMDLNPCEPKGTQQPRVQGWCAETLGFLIVGYIKHILVGGVSPTQLKNMLKNVKMGGFIFPKFPGENSRKNI